MAARVAVDFGTSNSLFAVWEEASQEARVPPLAEVSWPSDYQLNGHRERVDLVPSLIHYQEGRTLIGNQVRTAGLAENGATFRLMKRYLTQRRALPRQVAGRAISFPSAAADFLIRLLLFAGDYCNLAEDEVVFTLPVESFEHYRDWIATVCDDPRVNLRRFRVLDEPTACILGYAARVQEGAHYAVVDFGGGTLDVSVVKLDLEAEQARHCTVLGKAGVELGGADIDHWLYEEVLRRNRLTPDAARPISNLLLAACEQAKIALSSGDEAEVSALDDRTNTVIATDFVRAAGARGGEPKACDFEHLLQQHGLFRDFQATLDRALDLARECGVRKQDIRTVLAVGGSTLIPAVRLALEQNFPDRVQAHRPFDAIARGACRFAAGGYGYDDHIQHSYALRHYDSTAKERRFQALVKPGAASPSAGRIARLHLNGLYDGQREMRLEIFEIGEASRRRDTEIVYDANGSAMVQAARGQDERTHFWVNERNPTFIIADPPCVKGKPRFQVEFSIDANKRLLVTVLDLETSRLLYRDYPVVKLQ